MSPLRNARDPKISAVVANDERTPRGRATPPVCRDVFGDDDGIIHQQAHRYQQCHGADHVEGIAHELHGEEGAHERNGQPHRDPEGIAQPEKQPHDGEYQGQALDAVFQHHVEPVPDDG